MSNSLAKKFDKIVSKLGHKQKDTKLHDGENDNQDDTASEGNGDPQHESILQRMKGHLGHGSGKGEYHYHTEGAPPPDVIADDLKDSSFKGKMFSMLFVYIYVRFE